MTKGLNIVCIVLALLLFVCCGGEKMQRMEGQGSSAHAALAEIDSLMWRQPDSALARLQRFAASPTADSLDEFDGHYCQVLVSELLYKNYQPQTNRDELLRAVDYFDSLCGCRDVARNISTIFLDARAHYINGVGYYERDSVKDACREYLKSLEIMEGRFGEKELMGDKARFMALTYTRLTETFSDLYLHEQAICFAQQSLCYYNKDDTTSWHRAWILNEIGSQYDMMDNYDSASSYYHKSLPVVPDTNSLIYRDITSRLAYLSYKKGESSQLSLNLLRNLLSQTESEKEYLSRSLIYGEIYYLEQQFDSAWLYFAKVYERTKSVASKKLAAKRLLEISKTRNSDQENSEYATFVTQFATASEMQGTLNSDLIELYRQYGQNKAEQIHAQKTRKITVWTIWIVVALIVFIILILVFNKSIRNHNKKLLAQKQVVEKQLKAESYSHKMKQDAIGGRLKKSNEELRLQKEENDKLRKILETNRNQAETNLNKDKWNRLDDFMNEDICKEITASLNGKTIKREAKSDAYSELHLNHTQFLRLTVAVEKHFPGFGKKLTNLCPKINRDEMNQCILYLLDFEDVQIAALLSCDYSTVKKRSVKLKKAFGTEKKLRLFIREFVL